MKIYEKNIILPAGIGWDGAAYKRGYEDGEQAQKEKLISTSITENGTYTRDDGFSAVTVDVPQEEIHLEPLGAVFNANGNYNIRVHSGYAGFKSPANIYVEVPQTGYTEEDLRNAYQSGWTEAMEECQRDWSKEYLTLEALSGGTLNVNQPLDSSTNKGEWVSHESGYTLSLNAGDRVRFRGTALGQNAFSGNTLAFNVMGNAGSVIAGDDFEEVDNPGAGGMMNMFRDCSGLTDASRLILPSATAGGCYLNMFRNCSSLTDTPELPAIVLANDAYAYMFQNCTSLVTAPAIPATSMTYNSCAMMFENCTSLKNVPDLSVVIVNSNSLYRMFKNCVSLEKAPAVPIVEFASGSNTCCYEMFSGCSNLTTPPPILPATELVESCYLRMFNGCENLTTAPVLPATALTSSCYQEMFAGCLKMVSAPDLPAPVLVSSCYSGMFDACVRLAHIKCLATDISAAGCTEGWFNGHRPTGTFTKAAQMNDWSRGVSGIPEAWTVIDAV